MGGSSARQTIRSFVIDYSICVSSFLIFVGMDLPGEAFYSKVDTWLQNAYQGIRFPKEDILELCIQVFLFVESNGKGVECFEERTECIGNPFSLYYMW